MGILSAISSILYPTECPVCKRVLVKGEELFCTECLMTFPWSDPDFQPINLNLIHPDNTIKIRNLYSLFNYSKGADCKNLLYAIKYHNRPKLAFQMGLMLGKHIINHLNGDIIIPIPLHPKREKKRGYNQSVEIAKGVSEITSIPFNPNLLKRIKNTATLTDYNREGRFEAINGAFELGEASSIKDKHVIIVDDVITSGATTIAAATAMKHAGVKSFTLICVAKTSL